MNVCVLLCAARHAVVRRHAMGGKLKAGRRAWRLRRQPRLPVFSLPPMPRRRCLPCPTETQCVLPHPRALTASPEGAHDPKPPHPHTHVSCVGSASRSQCLRVRISAGDRTPVWARARSLFARVRRPQRAALGTRSACAAWVAS